MYQRILCPVDGSETSNCGLTEAIKLAKALNAQLRILHVIDLYFPVFSAMGDFNAVYMDDILRTHGHKVLNNAKDVAQLANISAETKMLETIGHPVSKLILEEAASWPADLIVMGTHGLRGFERIVMGSDAEAILRKSPAPVLLVKNTAKIG